MDFADLYARYAQDVFRFAYYLSGNRALAEDIAADTFVRALTAKVPAGTGSLKAYLLTIARHLFLDTVRADRRSTPLDGEHLDLADPAAGPEATTAGRLGLETLRDALQDVPEHERAALLMATVDGLSHDDIAAALGCSRAAVKVRVHRARLRLRHLRGLGRTTP
jgi:RNA polymerase sigma-70 factor (ECF subfamily)